MKYIAACALLALSLMTTSSIGKPIFVSNGYLTAQAWRDLSYRERMFYVMGAVDGTKSSPLWIRGDTGRLDRLLACLRPIDSEQLLAIMDKAVRDNPGKWNSTMNHIVTEEIIALCKP